MSEKDVEMRMTDQFDRPLFHIQYQWKGMFTGSTGGQQLFQSLDLE